MSNQELQSANDLITEMRAALNLAATNPDLTSGDAIALCAAMDRADAYLEGKAQVKYGCHVTARTNGEVLITCAFDFPDPIMECGGALFLKRKEDCKHWKPITKK